MEEFAQCCQRVHLRHSAVAVHRAIAERVDQPGLAEHYLPGYLLEARFVDQCGELVLVGQLEIRVVFVCPVHR